MPPDSAGRRGTSSRLFGGPARFWGTCCGSPPGQWFRHPNRPVCTSSIVLTGRPLQSSPRNFQEASTAGLDFFRLCVVSGGNVKKHLVELFFVVICVVPLAFAARDYQLLKKVAVPGSGGWDYLTVDDTA